MKKRYKVIIAGSGPSALSLAQMTAEEGLETMVVSPSIGQCWIPNYGSWFSDIDALGLSLCIEESWVSPMVILDDDTKIDLPFRYAKLSTNQLQTLLEFRCKRNGVQFLCKSVGSVHHKKNVSTVLLSDGVELDCDIFVDATGKGQFLEREKSAAVQGYQSAYGVLWEVEDSPWERGEMSLMDYRVPKGLSSGQRSSFLSKPTFLYALPLGKKLVFLEETSLVSRRPISFDELKQRLHTRMTKMGIEPIRCLDEERCLIPMGGSRPTLSQRTIGFGSAAGLVHPATGYQLAHSLSLAPLVAQAIRMGLEEGNPDETARLAWMQVWPKDKRRCWDMYQFGMDVLCSLTTQETQDFFRSFFSIPAHDWSVYLAGTGSPSEISKTMANVFLHAPFSIQKKLINRAIQPTGFTFVRSVLGL